MLLIGLNNKVLCCVWEERMLDQYYIIIMPVTPPELCSGYTKQFAGRLCACEIEKNALSLEKVDIYDII